MGAIAGIIYPEVLPVSYALEPALDRLASRDPGEAHTFLHKNIEIGTRGQQVTFNQSRTLCAVVDGQLDNAAQLQAELHKAGCQLHHPTTGDLILSAYDVWDTNFTSKLIGPFALAVYDLRKQKLILARDRLGIKPLYWARYNNYFIFASELKAILASGLIPQTPAADGIAAYLSLGYIPQDLSPIEHVNKLLPSHYLTISQTSPLAVTPYWSYGQCFASPISISQDDLTHELDIRLRHAMDRQLRAGESVSAQATSGLASAYLSTYLAGSPVHEKTTTISVNYATENEAEVSVAGDIASSLLLHHSTVSITPSTLLNNFARIVWHLDEPIASPIPSALLPLYSLAHGNSQLLFADLGGEAVLGTHRPPHVQNPTHKQRPVSPLMRRLFPNTAYKHLYQAHTDPWLSAYLTNNELFSDKQLSQLSPKCNQLFDPSVFLQRFHQLSRLGDGAGAQMYLDVKTRLCDRDMLQHDRIAAACGMRWRSPYLDDDVVTFMASVSESAKMPQNPADHPLAQIVHRSLPDQLFARASVKSPFFLDDWLHDAGFSRLCRIMFDGSLVEAGWLSRSWLSNALSGKIPVSFRQMWSLLSLEVWFQVFINRPISETPPKSTPIELLRGAWR